MALTKSNQIAFISTSTTTHSNGRPRTRTTSREAARMISTLGLRIMMLLTRCNSMLVYRLRVRISNGLSLATALDAIRQSNGQLFAVRKIFPTENRDQLVAMAALTRRVGTESWDPRISYRIQPRPFPHHRLVLYAEIPERRKSGRLWVMLEWSMRTRQAVTTKWRGVEDVLMQPRHRPIALMLWISIVPLRNQHLRRRLLHYRMVHGRCRLSHLALIGEQVRAV
jgi:hypothetical protein